jgi:hypothetical protein
MQTRAGLIWRRTTTIAGTTATFEFNEGAWLLLQGEMSRPGRLVSTSLFSLGWMDAKNSNNKSFEARAKGRSLVFSPSEETGTEFTIMWSCAYYFMEV